MICGGDADVLLEFVAAEDKMMEEIVGRLVTMSANRTRGYLFTHISMSPGAHIHGSVNHLLVEENGARIGRIPGEEDVLKSIPDPRLLKPSQILNVQDSITPYSWNGCVQEERYMFSARAMSVSAWPTWPLMWISGS